MKTHPFARRAISAGLLCVIVIGCGDDAPLGTPATTAETSKSDGAEPVIDPGDGGNYKPAIDPTRFSSDIDNPFMPWTVGSEWRYEGNDGDGVEEVVEITVLDETRVVMGVTVRVVRDRVMVGGELVEDTFDWYAQDAEGNVWYFGESVEDYDNGKVVSTAGSWEAGVDGAQPGIVMPADPRVGAAYRQEYFAGEAEDMFEIRRVDATTTTPFGDFDAVIVTTDWSPIEPDVVEEKYYAAGIGKVAEKKIAGGAGEVRLVEFRAGK